MQRLDRALRALAPLAAAAGVAPPAGQEWFDLLRNKLLAQLDLPPLLVVAIVGGTNIGKSVIFNLLAGEVASASSPLAAGTKHPVCLVPPELADPALLGRLFEPFALHAWRVGRRSAQAIRRRTAFSGGWERPCRRGCCSWMPPTWTPTWP